MLLHGWLSGLRDRKDYGASVLATGGMPTPAYIFAALALKKVDGPMPEYQQNTKPPVDQKPLALTSPPELPVST
jgi:hypothetical protein